MSAYQLYGICTRNGCNEMIVTAFDGTGKPLVRNQLSGQHITLPVYELFNDAGCISDCLLDQELRRMWKDRIFSWLEVCVEFVV